MSNDMNPDQDLRYVGPDLGPFVFVGFDSLHPSKQFFSYVGTGLPGLKQY